MNEDEIQLRLNFIRRAERLKDTLRSGRTTGGRIESVADHTWRLMLMVLTFADHFDGIDLLKLLKICVLHDLGEAVDGDIPAPSQSGAAPKSEKERDDFLSLIDPLPTLIQAEFLALWDDYENAASEEARMAKALDKIETLMQHNQGHNSPDFDYGFNLEYGRTHTDAVPLSKAIRKLIDHETTRKMRSDLSGD